MKNEQQAVKTEAKEEEPILKFFFHEMGKGGIWVCIARIVLCALFGLIPYGLGWLAFSDIFRYKDAPYKYKVEATLIDKTKKVTDEWYADKKKIMDAGKNYAIVENSGNLQYTEYKKHKFSIDYYLTWEYSIDGEKHRLTTTSWLVCFRRIGSKKYFQVFSEDGKEFKKGGASLSLFCLVVIILCVAVMLFLSIGVAGCFYGIVKSLSKNKNSSSGK